ncbi:MAG: hypothetical protein JWQ12_208 [Glaciihabitans sp.]|jgi:hypothetical protein|nr:hypothetical protein [Glaciihabitans sp.]
MSKLSRTISIPLAVVLALGTAPLLTGCFGNPIQNLVKGATGGQVDVGGTSIPADFPKNVPVLDGKVVLAGAIGKGADKVWNVTVQVTGADPSADLEAKLKSAGFKETAVTPNGTAGKSIVAADDTHSLLVVIAKDKDAWVVSYSVGPATSK